MFDLCFVYNERFHFDISACWNNALTRVKHDKGYFFFILRTVLYRLRLAEALQTDSATRAVKLTFDPFFLFCNTTLFFLSTKCLL